jgi:UV DNA damage repair endonuclease
MKIRFGYVATALSLWDGSPSKTITFTNWKKLKKDDRKTRLVEIAKQNIRNTKRALLYNLAHEIELYRLSSSIVPLATHPEVKWNYIKDLQEDFKELGENSDFISLDFILPFLTIAKSFGVDFDIMIEAKEKNRALFRLVEEVSKLRGVKRISGGTIVW